MVLSLRPVDHRAARARNHPPSNTMARAHALRLAARVLPSPGKG